MTIKKERVLIGVSGGPDSMALLAMTKDKYYVEVAHVNYHKRDTAKRDEDIVKNYCKEYQISFHKLDIVTYPDSGNFQDYARIKRYQFFNELCKQNNLNKVLIAHHQDDLIETYLFQKQRNSEVEYYGLKSEVCLYEIRVFRPLLDYTKAELLEYCIKNAIPYGIDESNLSDHYTRNKIRHGQVEKMTKAEREFILQEIAWKNDALKKEKERCDLYLNGQNKISVAYFLAYDDQVRLLRLFIGKNISKEHALELIRQIKESVSFEVLIDDVFLCKEYDQLEVYPQTEDYEYYFDKIKYGLYPFFCLSDSGNSFEGVTLKEDDFPICIRNNRPGDRIKMRYGTKKISRFFIDKKVSLRLRKMWPVVINAKGNIVLVPGIGCDYEHFSDHHDLYCQISA